jgi:putative ABC transport system ATP-binding protein
VRESTQREVPDMAVDDEVVLRARGLQRTYRMGDIDVQALRGVDLVLHRRELVVVLGPSGGGKSTLLHLLGALDVPTAGQILWRGMDLAQADEQTRTRFRRAHVGFVFQFYNLVPGLTARENVALVTELVPEPMSPEAALDLVGLMPRADHFPSQLSGGEQQRVAIARAVAKRPELLLCDEPTGALDLATGQVVLEAIEMMHEQLGTTVVLITHNAAIAGMADRVLRMAEGRIASDSPPPQRIRASGVQW